MKKNMWVVAFLVVAPINAMHHSNSAAGVGSDASAIVQREQGNRELSSPVEREIFIGQNNPLNVEELRRLCEKKQNEVDQLKKLKEKKDKCERCIRRANCLCTCAILNALFTGLIKYMSDKEE